MSELLPDYVLADMLGKLRRSGIRRAILLSSLEDESIAYLRTRLAKTGMLVMEPPTGQRVWLGKLAKQERVEEADVASLKSLLEDGLEHGIDALLVADEGLLAAVEACGLTVPIIRLCASREQEEGRIDNVVFDMGGVLMDWSPLKIARAFAENDEDAELLNHAVFDSREWGWQDAGAVDEDTVAWTSHLRLPERLWGAADEMAHQWHRHFDPMPETGRLVHELKAAGYGIYLLSNAGESFRIYQHRIPAIELFDGIVVSCFEHVVKPDRRLYQVLCDRYSLRPEGCLFLDDLERNVEGARRAGMQSVVFTGDVDAIREMLL